MQTSATQPTVDRLSAQAEREQLRSRDDTVLSAREYRDL
jgi:hypothetical protein